MTMTCSLTWQLLRGLLMTGDQLHCQFVVHCGVCSLQSLQLSVQKHGPH